MRIAIVAPLAESVPPKLYGGTERVVSYLTEELVRQDHRVVLFASGDSETTAELRAVTPRGLRLDPDCRDPLAHMMILLERVAQAAGEFDIIHFHIDYLHYALSRRLRLPSVTTLHGRLDLPDLVPLYRHFHDMPVVSVSNAQRKPLPHANWVATVHHGLPVDLHRAGKGSGGYVAVLGRISPEKGVDRAIRIARAVGVPLKIAAKVDRADKEYFTTQIKPLLDGSSVEYIGEIGEKDKSAFLGDALALLFPIEWPEPFGLVMVEAMACGTPVIAWRRGSVPEVIRDGHNGYMVDSEDAAVAALQNLQQIDRHRCRAVFEERFTAERMAHDYVQAYCKVNARVAAMEGTLAGA